MYICVRNTYLGLMRVLIIVMKTLHQVQTAGIIFHYKPHYLGGTYRYVQFYCTPAVYSVICVIQSQMLQKNENNWILNEIDYLRSEDNSAKFIRLELIGFPILESNFITTLLLAERISI